MRALRFLVVGLAYAACAFAIPAGATLLCRGIGVLIHRVPGDDDGLWLVSAGASVLLMLYPARVGLRELCVRWGLDERAPANQREAREHAPRILLP